MDMDRSFEHYGKRNKRSVWKTSVSSFKGHHYATFPPKLIDPCIQAGASAYGCCIKCGTPWERKFVKEKIEVIREVGRRGIEDPKKDIFQFVDEESKKEYKLNLVEKGWEKKCDCDTNEVKPCIVLDPFSGMATTGLVSLKYNHHYVGVELNEKYLKSSRDRLMLGYENYIKEVSDMKEL
jgi:hypothetical protein